MAVHAVAGALARSQRRAIVGSHRGAGRARGKPDYTRRRFAGEGEFRGAFANGAAGSSLLRGWVGPSVGARLRAVSMSGTWLNAWGKLPTRRLAAGSYSSASSPTS